MEKMLTFLKNIVSIVCLCGTQIYTITPKFRSWSANRNFLCLGPSSVELLSPVRPETVGSLSADVMVLSESVVSGSVWSWGIGVPVPWCLGGGGSWCLEW